LSCCEVKGGERKEETTSWWSRRLEIGCLLFNFRKLNVESVFHHAE